MRGNVRGLVVCRLRLLARDGRFAEGGLAMTFIVVVRGARGFILLRPGIDEGLFGDTFVLKVLKLKVEDALDKVGCHGHAVHVERRQNVLDQARLIDSGYILVVEQLGDTSLFLNRSACRLQIGKAQLLVRGMRQLIGKGIVPSHNRQLRFLAVLDHRNGWLARPDYGTITEGESFPKTVGVLCKHHLIDDCHTVAFHLRRSHV